ncbi:hypothetical protein BY458DRAFT_432466 [Sporodiniella umbellata]|nr:hypothetical protein BY458DRAFT_432466 [Sporodiniella umbellata]
MNCEYGYTNTQFTEGLIFDYLESSFKKLHEEPYLALLDHGSVDADSQFYTTDKFFLPQNVSLNFSSFSELQMVLRCINPYRSTKAQSKIFKRTTEEDLIHLASSTNFRIPSHIRINVQNSGLLDVLIDQAVTHWCCFGFKIAPITVEMVKNWKRAPPAIVYCVASISLVTLMKSSTTHERDTQANQEHSKQIAMAFYEEARNKMDDVFFDDIQVHIIQSYFCLSYTSNLLRLYEQQRTWGGLASIALKNLSNRKKISSLALGCWFRWYYIDAWMCLTSNRDCLLQDDVPWMDSNTIKIMSLTDDNSGIYSFACLAYYMRRYIRMLHSDKTFAEGSRTPSTQYYEITKSLIAWYSCLPGVDSSHKIHLHLCYHSVRLLILYQFIRPKCPPLMDILVDCLQTNLELLQALRQLKETGCDQSTYHHMFYAIHNVASRIHQYDMDSLSALSEEQLKMNFTLLKSTKAYTHDVFKMKLYAEKIQDQLITMNISTTQSRTQNSQMFVFKQKSFSLKKS